MKKILLLFLLLISISLFSQKHDYHWILGGECDTINIEHLASEMNFNADTLLPIPNPSIYFTLYTNNGNDISNWKHELMENGEGLSNEGNCSGQFTTQGILALPFPEQENQYILLSTTIDAIEITPDVFVIIMDELFYNKIDMTANKGEGKLTVKQELLTDDTIASTGNLTACKHANGRDWWVLAFKANSKEYYRYLFTPNGIESIDLLEVDLPVISGLGQAVFSPDGAKCAQINSISTDDGAYIDIFDFDRCTGVLSNQVQLWYAENAPSNGLAFSPNSRFLYASYYEYIFQYDMWMNDYEASKDTVAIHDGFAENGFLSTRFFLAQLAPNNKIYITTPSDGHFLHVIHHPDEKGMACNVEQRGLEWPTWKNISLPNFPHYRLGALEGSPCDSLSVAVNQFIEEKEIKIFPNPTIGNIHIKGKGPYDLELITSVGQTILYKKQNYDDSQLDIQNFPKGIYFLKIAGMFLRLDSKSNGMVE